MFDKETESHLKPLKSLGNKQVAEAAMERAFKEVEAYQSFLESEGLDQLPLMFEERRLTSKDSYMLAYDHFKLRGNTVEKIASYHRSSSSNHNLYWPRPKMTKERTILLKQYLEQHYHTHLIRSMCIVGTCAGSWTGWQDICSGLEHVSDIVDYPFYTFTPGNDVDTIVNFILLNDLHIPQFILFLCPSFIAYILEAVKDLGLQEKFPFHKLRFFTIGEPFNEDFRDHIDTLCPSNSSISSLFSVYGSADTDLIGAESLASVAIRKLIHRHKFLSKQMGFSRTFPHFFHFYAQDAYIESVKGELCITKWQGIPLPRYNLHDRVKLYSWKELRAFILSHKYDSPEDKPLYEIVEKSGEDLPDIIALFGRSDSSLKLLGTFITEEVLDHLMQSQHLSQYLTGHYKASVEYDDHQYLKLTVEMRPSVASSDDLTNLLYREVIEDLCEFQHEFKEDYEEIYKKFDDDPHRQILRLTLCKWPALSQELLEKTKRRGIESKNKVN